MQPRNRSFEMFDHQSLDTIEKNADRILAEVGVRFGDADTLDLWRQSGGEVSGDLVRLDGARLRAVIRATAPARFVLRARNAKRDVTVGGGSLVAAPIYGAPNLLLPGGQRESGSLALYRGLVSTAHAAPALANTGQMICVMNDVAEHQRPLEMALAHLSLSDKPFMGSVASPQAARDVMAALALAHGGRLHGCHLLHLINATPPLGFQANPLQCLRTIATSGQGCLVTAYMMMGATAPVTAMGALAQGYAEVLAGMALTQLWSPGAPVVMGIFGMPFSMRSMVPVYGDPISRVVQYGAVQLARRLGVPVRGDAGLTSAKLDDAQAGYESAGATHAAVLAGADFLLHSAGWLENGRTVGVEKFTRDAAMLGGLLGLPEADAPPVPLDVEVEREIRQLIAALKPPAAE